MNGDFAELLDFHMGNRMMGNKRLADLVNQEYGDICKINRSTIQKWRARDSIRVRNWRQVASIANILHLNKQEAEQLLLSAKLPNIHELWEGAKLYEQKLLESWQRTEKRIPLQLPPRPVHFTNRSREIDMLLNALKPGHVITLCGTGGIGKSALVAEVIWRLTPDIKNAPQEFPDGIIYYNFEDQPQSDRAFEHFALSYHVEPRPTPALAALRALSGKHSLIILESCENAADLFEVLKVRSGCSVLVTTRNRANVLETHQDLTPLSNEESTKLLQKWGEKFADNDEAVVEICSLVGNLPLAVRLIGRYLIHRREKASEYLKFLEATPLLALSQGQRQDESIPRLLENTFSQLTDGAHSLLEIMGFLAATSISSQLLQTVSDLDTVRFQKSLTELADYGLIMRVDNRYQVTHVLIHTYARKNATISSHIVDKLFLYYQDLIEAHRSLSVATYRLLDVERPHLTTLVEKLNQRQAWENSIGLVRSIDRYLAARGNGAERIKFAMAGLHAAQSAGLVKDESFLSNKLGDAYRFFGQFKEALASYHKSHELVAELNDPSETYVYFSSMGSILLEMGEFSEAKEYFHQALSLARGLKEQENEARQLNRLGLVHRELGEYDEAVDFHQQSIEIAQNIPSVRQEAASVGNLGSAYREMGKPEMAIECHMRALSIAKEVGNQRGEAESLGNLGLAYRILGRLEEAKKSHQSALEIARQVGYKRLEANQLGNLGLVYHELSDSLTGIDLLREAITISNQIGALPAEGSKLSQLADIYADIDNVAEAIRFYKKSLSILEEINSPIAMNVRNKLSQLRD